MSLISKLNDDNIPLADADPQGQLKILITKFLFPINSYLFFRVQQS